MKIIWLNEETLSPSFDVYNAYVFVGLHNYTVDAEIKMNVTIFQRQKTNKHLTKKRLCK